MKRAISNAFTNGAARRSPRQNVASLLASMQAGLTETDSGWSLGLQPIRLIDLVPVWTRSQPSRRAETLLIDLHGGTLPTGGTNIRTVAGTDLELVAKYGDDAIVVGDLALAELAPHIESKHLLLVRVDGPIERRDAEAIRAAVTAGRSALDAELRAVAAAIISRNRTAAIDTRERGPALALVAENFRHYLAALCNQPMGQYEAPSAGQLDRLFAVSGRLTVRPIETDVLPTSIDIGISTTDGDEPGPATHSLIYDLPSQTWHDEE